jgi:hypothetical protein
VTRAFSSTTRPTRQPEPGDAERGPCRAPLAQSLDHVRRSRCEARRVGREAVRRPDGAAPRDRAARPDARRRARWPRPPRRNERDAARGVYAERRLFSAAAFTPAAAIAPIAAPVDVRFATPVGAPDFAQALGTQVSVLAGNGVQRAELHLNPAEMGPVSVQIVIDGGQARVDFGADLAATRHAIENGLPELASALRDAGLTLTGGGVSQHARGRGDRGSRPAMAPPAAAVPAPKRNRSRRSARAASPSAGRSLRLIGARRERRLARKRTAYLGFGRSRRFDNF